MTIFDLIRYPIPEEITQAHHAFSLLPDGIKIEYKRKCKEVFVKPVTFLSPTIEDCVKLLRQVIMEWEDDCDNI